MQESHHTDQYEEYKGCAKMNIYLHRKIRNKKRFHHRPAYCHDRTAVVENGAKNIQSLTSDKLHDN